MIFVLLTTWHVCIGKRLASTAVPWDTYNISASHYKQLSASLFIVLDIHVDVYPIIENYTSMNTMLFF